MDRLLVEMGRMKMSLDEREVVNELHEICRIPVSRYLVSDVAKLEPELRRKAARVLMRIADDSVILPLIQALDDPDPEVRVYAAHALRDITNAMICGDPEAFREPGDELEALKKQAREYHARRRGGLK